jgi:hypothetical protein
MGATSNETKTRWNHAHYVQVKVSVKPEIAAAFKAKCMTDGVSMASEISRFMSGQAQRSAPAKTHENPYATRRLRRKALRSLTLRLEAITEAERAYLYNIPENLRNSQSYEAAENAVSVFEEALALLEGAY